MSRSDDGYTLLETLVAFAILATVLVALYAASGTAVRLVDGDTHMRLAALLAQSRLDEIEASHDPLPMSQAGAFAGSGISWRVEARDLPGSAAGLSALRLQDVKLTLSWPQGAGAATLVIVTRHLGAVRQ
jgi:general secretion pathway protein I